MLKCLMIKTKDNRKFFTHEKNFLHLIEFSKAFDAEISIVKLSNSEIGILELNELAPAICNPSYKNKSEYELITTKIAKFKKIKPQPPSNKRKTILTTALSVHSYIEEQFLSGCEVSIKNLLQKFPQLHISTLCNHIKNVINELKIIGKITKIGRGKYMWSKD